MSGATGRMLLCRQIGGKLQAGGSCLSLRVYFYTASGPWPQASQCRVAGYLVVRGLTPTQADWHGLASGRRQLFPGVHGGQKGSRGFAERELEMETGLVNQVVKETEAVAELCDVEATPGAEDVPSDKHVDTLGVVEDGNVQVQGELADKSAAVKEADEAVTVGASRRSVFPDAEYFELTRSCKLVLQSGDITEWCVDGHTDAIVNAANQQMLGGGGVDGAIHEAAGSGLYRACRAVLEVKPGVRCPTGQAVVTDAFDLPVAKVIHTVGPVYKGRNPAALLASAYENSAKRALEAGLEYVCFPAISCGIYSYPHDEAAEVALETLQKNCEGLKEVHFVLFDSRSQRAWFREARAKLKSLTS